MLRSRRGGIWQIKGLWERVCGGESGRLKPVLLLITVQAVTVESLFWSYFDIFFVCMPCRVAFIVCSIRVVGRVNHSMARDGHPRLYNVLVVWF